MLYIMSVLQALEGPRELAALDTREIVPRRSDNEISPHSGKSQLTAKPDRETSLFDVLLLSQLAGSGSSRAESGGSSPGNTGISLSGTSALSSIADAAYKGEEIVAQRNQIQADKKAGIRGAETQSYISDDQLLGTLLESSGNNLTRMQRDRGRAQQKIALYSNL